MTARVDGYLNLTYRALKSDRAGRRLERRLDAAESVPWLLDVVFALSYRVRPYGSYLAWELRQHPLEVQEWSADVLLPQLQALLDGDSAALRDVVAVVERECRRTDNDDAPMEFGATFDAWGSGLDLKREPLADATWTAPHCHHGEFSTRWPRRPDPASNQTLQPTSRCTARRSGPRR